MVPVLAYSDASWWSLGRPRLGWLFLWPDGVQAVTAKLTRQVVRKWLPLQQIMCEEAPAPLIALHHSAEQPANQEVLWFVDNLSAVSSLIRGSVRREDVGHIASMRVWYEWGDLVMVMCHLSRQLCSKLNKVADAQMSVGTMELISRAASKMTNSAAAGELTSAEIWTLARTAIELFGASVSKCAIKFASYSIGSSLFIDTTAKRDDGQFWDLGTREDQEKLNKCSKNIKQNA